jgi:hypothetical protein
VPLVSSLRLPLEYYEQRHRALQLRAGEMQRRREEAEGEARAAAEEVIGRVQIH